MMIYRPACLPPMCNHRTVAVSEHRRDVWPTLSHCSRGEIGVKQANSGAAEG